MAQWWVWWGDKVLHKPLTDEWNVEDGRLGLAVSTAGSFDATITPLHPLYTELIEAPVKGDTLVRVERDGNELWRGFLESREVRPLDGALDVRFVGELGYLANTVMPPYSQKGSPRHIVTYWLNAHNAQAAPAQKIYTGRVDIADKGGNDYIVRACDKPTNMWTEISSKTIESSDGGFLVLRRVNGKLYLDWVNDPSVPGGQPVKLGFNLTDMSDLVDGSELLTAVYPLGATVSETVDETVVEDGKTVTRKKTVSRTVNLDEYPDFTRGGISKRGHLIVNDELADIHGIIAEVVSWPDVELPSNLLDRAMDYVASLGEPRSITLSATDMSNAGYDVEAFSLAQRIKLDTPTVKGEMLVTGITYDILDPTSDTITFGDVASTASGQQVQTGILVNNAAMQAETAKLQSEAAEQLASESIASAKTLWAVSDSPVVEPNGSWTDERPIPGDGEYLWSKIVTSTNGGDETESSPTPVGEIIRYGTSTYSIRDVDPGEWSPLVDGCAASPLVEAQLCGWWDVPAYYPWDDPEWYSAEQIGFAYEYPVFEGECPSGYDPTTKWTGDTPYSTVCPGTVLRAVPSTVFMDAQEHHDWALIEGSTSTVTREIGCHEFKQDPWTETLLHGHIVYKSPFKIDGLPDLDGYGEPRRIWCTFAPPEHLHAEDGYLYILSDGIGCDIDTWNDYAFESSDGYELNCWQLFWLYDDPLTETYEVQPAQVPNGTAYIGLPGTDAGISNPYTYFTYSLASGSEANEMLSSAAKGVRFIDAGPGLEADQTSLTGNATINLNLGEGILVDEQNRVALDEDRVREMAGIDAYASSPEAAGNADRSNAILYGVVDATSTSTAFTATIDGLNELVDGTCVMLHNGVVTSAAGFTVDINSLGAKPCYSNMTNATQDTTIFNVAYTMLFVYSSSLDSGNGGWWIYRGYDSNTNTIGYQLRTNSSTLPASDKGYRYRLWFTSADGAKLVPANTSTSTNATARRTPNTTPIDPYGPIVYNSTNGTTNAGANPTAANLWQQYTLTLGYSFNATNSDLTLSFPAPVYVVCSPQSDGSAVLQGYSQALPSTADGYIYIYLGIAYSATNIELRTEHPVYFYSDGAVRLWDNKSSTDPLSNIEIEALITNAG